MSPLRCIQILGASLLASAGAASAQIVLNDETPLAFGDPIATVAARLKEKPADTERGRPGVDRMIALTSALLFFDTDRLARVVLKENHLFPQPLRPFREEWKNFAPLGGKAPGYQMTRATFGEYLEAWKARAAAEGKKENEDYWIKQGGGAVSGETVTLGFAPRRRLMGTGTLTGDAIVFTFSGETAARFGASRPAGVLNTVAISGDEFSTLRRATPEASRPPAPRHNGRPRAAPGERGGSVTLDDGRRVTLGASLAELEKTLGFTAPVGAIESWGGAYPLSPVPTAAFFVDSGRLAGVRLNAKHTFVHPLRVFDDGWKNLDPIGEQRLKQGLTLDEANAYLTAWKDRAQSAGKREGTDYHILMGALDPGVVVIVSFLPGRLALDGLSSWSDLWELEFLRGAANGPELAGVAVQADAFVTMGRPPAGMPDPALASVTLEDRTELYFGQERDEVERLLGAKATAFSTRPSARGNVVLNLNVTDVSMSFDSDKLTSMSFTRFADAPAPFPTSWKNLPTIDGHRVSSGMRGTTSWRM